MGFIRIPNLNHYKILDNIIMEKSVHFEIQEEKYVDETPICNCKKDDCEKCDPEWLPGIDTCGDESDTDYDSSDYDSSDSMDDVYEDCGLSRSEKKILQDELDELIAQAEIAICRLPPLPE